MVWRAVLRGWRHRHCWPPIALTPPTVLLPPTTVLPPNQPRVQPQSPSPPPLPSRGELLTNNRLLKTQIYTIMQCFSSFLKIDIFCFLSALGVKEPPLGSDYSLDNTALFLVVIEWFEHFIITNFSSFWQNKHFFQICYFFSLFRSFQTQGPETIL